MQEKIVLLRFLAVPLRQKLVAAGIAVAIGSGLFIWSRHIATQSATTAVLSYYADPARQIGPGVISPAKEPAVALARSILSNEMIRGLSQQAGVPFTGTKNDGAEFRSRLEMTQPSTKLLCVNYRDADKKLSAAVANSIANILAAWTPSPAVAPTTAGPALSAPAPQTMQFATPTVTSTQLRRRPSHPRSDVLRGLEEQLAETDQKLAVLDEQSLPSSASWKADGATAPSSKDNDQERALELQLSAAQKKLDDLRVLYTDEYPDVERVKEDIADIGQKLATIRSVSHEAEQPAGPEKPDASENVANQLRLNRARLTKVIAVEKRHEEMLRMLDTSSMPMTAQTAPSLAQGQPTSRPSVSPTASQVLHSPFTVMRLAGNTGLNDSVENSLWRGAFAGAFCALLYLAGAIWRYRPIASAEEGEQLASQSSAEAIPDSSGSEERWEEEVRRAISLTVLGREEAALSMESLRQVDNCATGVQGQLHYNEVSEAIREKIKRNPNSWMAHTEEARIALAAGDFNTAVKEMKFAIAVAPEKLKAQLDKIVMELDRNVSINK